MPYRYGDRGAALLMRAAKFDPTTKPVVKAGHDLPTTTTLYTGRWGEPDIGPEVVEHDDPGVMGAYSPYFNTIDIRAVPWAGPSYSFPRSLSDTVAHEVGHRLFDYAFSEKQDPDIQAQAAALFQESAPYGGISERLARVLGGGATGGQEAEKQPLYKLARGLLGRYGRDIPRTSQAVYERIDRAPENVKQQLYPNWEKTRKVMLGDLKPRPQARR